MVCSSPVIEADEDKLDADNPLKLEYGFRMDNVTGVQNLTTLNKDFAPFLLFPNPIFTPFDKEVKYYKSDYLNINVSINYTTRSRITFQNFELLCNVFMQYFYF